MKQLSKHQKEPSPNPPTPHFHFQAVKVYPRCQVQLELGKSSQSLLIVRQPAGVDLTAPQLQQKKTHHPKKWNNETIWNLSTLYSWVIKCPHWTSPNHEWYMVYFMATFSGDVQYSQNGTGKPTPAIPSSNPWGNPSLRIQETHPWHRLLHDVPSHGAHGAHGAGAHSAHSAHGTGRRGKVGPSEPWREQHMPGSRV